MVRPAFEPLPLTAIGARGWLVDQLRLQADGFTGHLPDHWPDVGPNSGWLGGSGESWERGPYYCDGLIPLAYLLGDRGLIERAGRWVEWSLASQRPDGWFGPAGNDDWWPRMVMLKAITQYAEATGDDRVIPFLTQYFAYQARHLRDRPLAKWGEARGAENVLSILWLHRRTGDDALLDLARLIQAQTLDWTDQFEQFPARGKQRAFSHFVHVVNVAMALKEPALRWLIDGDPRFAVASAIGLENLDRYHGQVTGMFSGDEWLAGTHPSQGVELCAVVEAGFSLAILARAFGDVRWADRLERVMFNALPATIDARMRARQYDQQPNQVLCTVAPRGWTSNRPDANTFGLSPHFGCCTANLHQGWPKFAAALWAVAPDGLAALAWAPCHVTGSGFVLDVRTEYPFADTVHVHVEHAPMGPASLHLRIPSWADRTTQLTVNGEPQTVRAGSFVVLTRDWRSGNQIVIQFGSEIAREMRPSGGVAIVRGPLVFALRIQEDWRRIERRVFFDDWEVHPATPWNYGLARDEFTLCRREVSRVPFDGANPPLILRGTGARVPSWTLWENSADAPPAGPIDSGTPREAVDLIPYGSARLRVTEFLTLAT